LLFLRAARPPCSYLPRSRLCSTTHAGRRRACPWRIRRRRRRRSRRLSWWICWRRQPRGNLLQMWGAQSLCSRLPGSGDEVLCMREAGKIYSLALVDREKKFITDHLRATSLETALRQTAARSIRLARSATSAAQRDISLVTAPRTKPTGRSLMQQATYQP
jgi:hypothetical protein